MTEDQFVDALRDFGERKNNLSPILTQIGGRLVDQIKQDAPVDSGALKQSIKAVIEQDSLSIEMMYYGIFQNYGVDGIQNAPAREVPSYGVMQPTAGRRFGFGVSQPNEGQMISGDSGLSFGARKKIYKMGLKPQRFFDVDIIAGAIADGVAQQLTTEF